MRTDVTELAKLTNLTNLGLRRNQIADITPLELLVNLKRLNVDDNPTAGFTPLERLIHLGGRWQGGRNFGARCGIADAAEATALVHIRSLVQK